jgi:hypothetical protein
VTYASRIPADGKYLVALGRAFYNFTYLEWIVISTIAKLSTQGHEAVPRRQGAKFIARALLHAVESAEPRLEDRLRRQLLGVHESFLEAIKRRNKLLHAHPFTNHEGDQRLGADHREWTMAEVDEAARFFEELAVHANGIYHDELCSSRA